MRFLDTQVSLAPTHVSPSVRPLVRHTFYFLSKIAAIQLAPYTLVKEYAECSNLMADMVNNMEANKVSDIVADMEVDKVADMLAGKMVNEVADMEVDKMAYMVADMEVDHGGRRGGRHGG